MAGYIFALGNDNPNGVYKNCVLNGVYSTRLNSLASIPFEGTLADYTTMQEGDNIYFFFERRIYGIGTLVRVGNDCKYCNYPKSCELREFDYTTIRPSLLLDYGIESPRYRWLCTFTPSPDFFIKGVDMDDVLTYKPDTFRALRTFWKASFIKLGEEENQSLKEIILLRNQEALSKPNSKFVYSYSEDRHLEIKSKITKEHFINISDLLGSCCNGDYIKHEMAIEAASLHMISAGSTTIFGSWDYLSHQVAASPFKPVDYMDKIDIFGSRFIEGTKIISKYLVIEIKKDIADVDAVSQICKYVDWVCKEYAYGDYSFVEGYVLAYDFTKQAISQKESICERTYTRGSHPIENKSWNDIKLINYKFDGTTLQYKEKR